MYILFSDFKASKFVSKFRNLSNFENRATMGLRSALPNFKTSGYYAGRLLWGKQDNYPGITY